MRHWIPRVLLTSLIVFLTACPKRDDIERPGDKPPLEEPVPKPVPEPVPPPSSNPARQLLTDLTGPDAAKRQAAAESVFVRDAERLTMLVERHGKNAVLQLFLAGASSEDDLVRKMAMSALAAQLSSRERPLPESTQGLILDLQFLLLEEEEGLYAKERVEPGIFIVKSTKKCAGMWLSRCLALTSSVVNAEEQIALQQLGESGLTITANGTVLAITPEGMNSELTYTYKVDKLDQREGKVAVWLTLSGSTPGLVEGGPLKVYVDPFLLELIGAQKFLAFWRKPPPPAGTTCCYYLRLVGDPSCPTCVISQRGPQAACPNNIRTCGRATADSTLCFRKAAAGGVCAALTPAEVAACKQGTGC